MPCIKITDGRTGESFLVFDFLPFPKAREYAHSLGLKSSTGWYKHANEKGLPEGIPPRPDYTYKNKGWINWREFLSVDFLPFSEAKEYAISLGLNTQVEWRKHSKKNGHPEGIPHAPEGV